MAANATITITTSLGTIHPEMVKTYTLNSVSKIIDNEIYVGITYEDIFDLVIYDTAAGLTGWDFLLIQNMSDTKDMTLKLLEDSDATSFVEKIVKPGEYFMMNSDQIEANTPATGTYDSCSPIKAKFDSYTQSARLLALKI